MFSFFSEGIVEYDGRGEKGAMEVGLGMDPASARFRIMPPGIARH